MHILACMFGIIDLWYYRMKETYTCRDCKKPHETEPLKYSRWTRCPFCNGQAYDSQPIFHKTYTTFIPGYSSAGYNEGLGVHIKDKSHLKQVLKERNLKEAG